MDDKVKCDESVGSPDLTATDCTCCKMVEEVHHQFRVTVQRVEHMAHVSLSMNLSDG